VKADSCTKAKSVAPALQISENLSRESLSHSQFQTTKYSVSGRN